MKQRHPIDDIFKRKLEQHTIQPSPGLWDKIDAQRQEQQYWSIFWKRNANYIVLGFGIFTLATVGLLMLQQPAEAPSIQYFPIPHPGVDKAIAEIKVEEKTPTPPNSTAPVINTSLNQKPDQSLAFISPQIEQPIESQEGNEILPREEQEVENSTASFEQETIAALNIPRLPAFVYDTRNSGRSTFPQDPKCAKFSEGKFKLYFELLASPDMAFRNLKTKSNNSEDEAYVESREGTESGNPSYSISARISAVTGIGLAFRTGVNYSQINEQFDYVNESEERITITNIFDADGEFVRTDTIVEVGTRTKETSNSFRQLDIPIIVGYEFTKKNWTITANGGAYINLLYRQKGDFLSPQDLQPVSFSSNDPDAYPAFKERLGISWYASLGLAYKVNSRMHVMVEPHLRFYPKSVTRDQYIVDQKYFTTGLFIGLRHQF